MASLANHSHMHHVFGGDALRMATIANGRDGGGAEHDKPVGRPLSEHVLLGNQG